MKRWLGWTRANSLRLDHVGFFLEKAVSGWNSQEKCHPVLSRLSSSVALTSLIFVESLFLWYWTMSLVNACQQTWAFFSRETKWWKNYKWKLLFLSLVCSIYKKNSMYGTWKAFWTSEGRFDKWAKAKQDTDIPSTVQAKPFYLAWYKSCFPLLVYILLQWQPHFPSGTLWQVLCYINGCDSSKMETLWPVRAKCSKYESVYVTALCFINYLFL